jgi:glycerophosphoryl diester phosphodiesterase
MSRKSIAVGISGVLLLLALWINNSSFLAKPLTRRPLLLAHRGVAQQFPLDGVAADTCTATRIFPPHNKFLENTIPSMEEAFKDGADVVEFDIHPTTDGSWAVFHDWTLDCRTNGHGFTRKQTFSYLRTLDVGYGYTADGGKTFPLRGQGIGLMPSLDAVLNTFPNSSFLITIKSKNPKEGVALSARLKKIPDTSLRRLMVNGDDLPIAVIRNQLPTVRKMEKRCLISYIATGWSGYISKDCRNSMMMLPANIAPLLWGWPNRFIARMDGAGTSVFLVDDLSLDDLKAGRSQGINSLEDLQRLPKGYSGGIWTDAIETVGPALRTHD